MVELKERQKKVGLNLKRMVGNENAKGEKYGRTKLIFFPSPCVDFGSVDFS